jgi:integrase
MSKPKKRGVSDVPIFLDNRLWKELSEVLTMEGWNYKVNMTEFHQRDKALICLLLLSGCRISEALDLKKIQFRTYDNEIILANVKTEKNGLLRKRIVLPKKGKFEIFSTTFEEWLNKVPTDDSYIFPSATPHGNLLWNQGLSRYRAHRIIKYMTGKFPHWYRAVCENIYGKIVFKNDAWKLKGFMGYKNLDSTSPYVSGSWEEDEKRIYTV